MRRCTLALLLLVVLASSLEASHRWRRWKRYPRPQPTPTDPTPTPTGIPGGVPSWGYAIVWDNVPPFYSKSGVQLTWTGAWLNVLHDTNIPGSSKVEIDWLRVMCQMNDGSVRTLRNDEYTTSAGGGMWTRVPYFAGEQRDPLLGTVSGGSLIMYPSQWLAINRMAHIWSNQRTQIPAGAVKLWFECRLRITGGAAVQAGGDIMQDASSGPRWVNGVLVNWNESSRSPWQWDTQGEFVTISSGK